MSISHIRIWLWYTRNLHLLFSGILSFFALTFFSLMVLFCIHIRRDSVFLLMCLFLNLRDTWLVFLLELYPYNCFSSYFCLLVTAVLLNFMLSAIFWSL